MGEPGGNRSGLQGREKEVSAQKAEPLLRPCTWPPACPISVHTHSRPPAPPTPPSHSSSTLWMCCFGRSETLAAWGSCLDTADSEHPRKLRHHEKPLPEALAGTWPTPSGCPRVFAKQTRPGSLPTRQLGRAAAGAKNRSCYPQAKHSPCLSDSPSPTTPPDTRQWHPNNSAAAHPLLGKKQEAVWLRATVFSSPSLED